MMYELRYPVPARTVHEILGAAGDLPLAECAELHAALERRMAGAVGGAPRSGLRPPVVIADQTYEALPGFLLDPDEIRHGAWRDDIALFATEEELAVMLRRIAELVLTHRSVQRLLDACTTQTPRLTAISDLRSVIGRMCEKGVV